MLAGIFLFFTLNIFGYVVFSFYLCRKLKILSKMRNVQWAVLAITGLVVLAGCKEKKQSQDIIAPRLEVKKPSAPIRMQTYSDQRSVEWLGKETGEQRFQQIHDVIFSSLNQLLPTKERLCGIGVPGFNPEVVQHTHWDYGRNGKGFYNDIFAPGWTVASLWELYSPQRTDSFLKMK